MIYLFNSGFSEFYRVNTLNTLYLPSGWTNSYRYNLRNLDYSDLESFGNGKLIGEKVLISFIDRFNKNGKGENEYKYYPLRIGELLSINNSEGQYFFNVKILDYVFPRNLDGFQEKFKHTLKSFPKFVENPENIDDGVYVVNAPDVLTVKDEYKFGSGVWRETVENLKEVYAFKNNKDHLPIFLKGELYDDKEQVVAPEIKNGFPYYSIIRNQKYYFQINYVFPSHSVNPHIELEFNKGDNLIYIGEIDVGINNYSDIIKYSFSTKTIIEQKDSQFVFKGVSPQGTHPFIISRRPHQYSVIESKKFNFEIIFIFLLFPVLGFFASTDLDKLFLLKWYLVVGKFIAVLLQAFFLWRIYKLFGRRILS